MSDSHTTTHHGVKVAWWVRDRRPTVIYLEDPERDEPACRWPNIPLPAMRGGHVAFGPSKYPTLAEVRDWLPEYAALWDQLDADYRTVLSTQAKTDQARWHQAFLATPAGSEDVAG